MNPRFILIAIFAICTTHADTTADSAELPETVITATGSPVDSRQIGSSLSVIHAQDFRMQGVQTVGEALRGIPGVSVTQQGGPGRLYTVFLRGHKPDETLVLIDGIPQNSPSAGGFDFSSLSLANVEKIEILRGPQSALYGSDAMAGVIHIITKRGERELSGHAQVSAGNHGAAHASGSLNGGNDHVDFSLAYQHDRFGELSAADTEGDDDDWRNHGIRGRLGWNLPSDGRLELHGSWRDVDLDVDAGAFIDDPNAATSRTRHVGGVQLEQPIGELLSLHINASVTDEKLSGTDPDTAWNNYLFDTRLVHLDTRVDYLRSSQHTLSLGYEFEREAADTGAYDREADRRAIFAQSHWGSDHAGVTAGVRYDDDDTFGSETTWRLAGTRTCEASGMTFHGAVGTGFKAPNFNGLYFPGANPNLKPERSLGWDAGVSQNLLDDTLELSATYFHSEVEDFIKWNPLDPTDPNSLYAPQNIQARLKGVELATELQLSTALSLHAGATWQNLVDRSIGKKLVRRAKRSATFGATYLWESGAHLNATVQYVGPRFNDRANTTTLDSYARVDLAGSLPIRENLSLFGRVENIGDVDYREVNGYTVPGRTARVGLRLDF